LDSRWVEEVVGRLVRIRMEVLAYLIAMLSHWEMQGRWVGRIVGRLAVKWIHMDGLNRRLVRGSLVETCWLVGGFSGSWFG